MQGTDIAPESPAPPATVYLITDGRIADIERVSPQRLDIENMIVYNVGTRSDNVAVLAMDARRHYERPEALHVFATVRNFGPDPVEFEAFLYIDGSNVDAQTVRLQGVKPPPDGRASGRRKLGEADVGTVAAVAFDEVEFEGAGVIEVRLMIDDALAADNRAWTLIDAPRSVKILLVTSGNLFLENVLATLPIELTTMTAARYESAPDKDLIEDDRSCYDVVILDGHSTARLPQGNYFFWGGIPQIEGVSIGKIINDQIIFNWDETHPILRHVAVETIDVYEWFELSLPNEAVSLIDGQTSPVLSYLTRDANQYLISAFRLLGEDDFGNPLMNTYWVTKVHFVVFVQNAVQYLASAISTTGVKTVLTGNPVTLPVPDRTRTVQVHRPDNTVDAVPTGGFPSINYARTRLVGVYGIEPGIPGDDRCAVNLFDVVESDVAPAQTIAIGSKTVAAQASSLEVNKPAWPWFLLAVLAFLVIEWIVYNKRVFI